MSKLRTTIRLIILKTLDSSRKYWKQKTVNHQNAISKVRFSHLGAVAFISWILRSDQAEVTAKSHFDTEKQVSQLIKQAEELIIDGKLKEAKNILNDAIKLADANQAYGSISYICDLLSSIVLNEGDFHEAENILVKFTEKLLQLGFPETHNSIVTFKLKLARIYQLVGSQEMAEYGFQDCIRVQEKKLYGHNQLDEESNGIYLTALYWYGKLLADQQDFNRARRQYLLCWERILKSSNILPPQKMVVLHSIASVSASLKDFDGALNYLYDALEICLLEDPNNIDLPIFIVQVGLIFLQKKVYESALFWCQTGYELAIHEENEVAKTEGQTCIQELQKLKILP